MKPCDVVTEGLVTTDVHANPKRVLVRFTPEGVCLKDGITGDTCFIETETAPTPGAKVFAKRPLANLLETAFVDQVEMGGGALRTAAAYACEQRHHTVSGAVRLVNSGTASSGLARYCKMLGIQCDSLGRHMSPTNLVIGQGHDRLIIKERVTSTPGGMGYVETVQRAVSDAGAVACVSGKDSSVAAALLALCNGARRIVQPTGSLDPTTTLSLVSRAHEVVCNFAEWAQLAVRAGLAVSSASEEDADAFDVAERLMRALHERRLAGAEAAVCTLGRRGAVVADWAKPKVYRIPLKMLDGPGVPTPAGTGDAFLGKYLFYRQTWALTGCLRDPVIGAALYAMHSVASTLGLRRGQYELQAVPV